MTGAVINWALLGELHTKPHPNMDHVPPSDLPLDTLEVLQEALAAQHLLDLAGIPLGERLYDRDLDARVFLAVTEISALRERLDRLGGWHERETGPAGTVGTLCIECGRPWPCDSRRMAEGTYTEDEGGESS